MKRLAPIFIGLLLFPRIARAQDLGVPIPVQIPLLARILGFDRNLADRKDSSLGLAIVYQSRYRPSRDVAEAVEANLAKLAGSERGVEPLRAVLVDLDQNPNLDAVLAREQVAIAYVCPLRAVDPARIASATRGGRIRSFTGVVDYVETALAVGIGLRGDHPEIIINLEAARAEGADFGAQLLKLARVVGAKGTE